MVICNESKTVPLMLLAKCLCPALFNYTSWFFKQGYQINKSIDNHRTLQISLSTHLFSTLTLWFTIAGLCRLVSKGWDSQKFGTGLVIHNFKKPLQHFLSFKAKIPISACITNIYSFEVCHHPLWQLKSH